MLRLLYCPSCSRVFFLPDENQYLCGRNHAPSVWPDGKRRRFVISERAETNQPPWVIPPKIEERELIREDLVEMWLDTCKHPEDKDYGDTRRHFGFSAPGGRHLTREETIAKYAEFTLKLVW
jgi:hypothetical protein